MSSSAASAGFRSTRAGTRVPATAQHASGTRRQKCQALNEGRDSRPGNGGGDRQGCPEGPVRSTRAGTRVPATGGIGTADLGPEPRSLNEGRDSRPGNGPTGTTSTLVCSAAQRGPGLASRQRASGAHDGRGLPLRSTRAGTRVPATGDEDLRALLAQAHAQRGPGLASRQRGVHASQPGGATATTLNEGRDSRPGNGAVVPVREPAVRPRSTRAGTRVPATGGRDVAGRTGDHPPLNEGRDSRPGNGLEELAGAPVAGERSTRAGTRVPATGSDRHALDRRHVDRSTRAGTRVPATDDALPRAGHARCPLNEGRDSRPGNGRARAVRGRRRHHARCPLNEGRDSRPGNGCRRA